MASQFLTNRSHLSLVIFGPLGTVYQGEAEARHSNEEQQVVDWYAIGIGTDSSDELGSQYPLASFLTSSIKALSSNSGVWC